MKTKQIVLFASGLMLLSTFHSCKQKHEPVEKPNVETSIETKEERIVINEAELEKERTEFKHSSEMRIEENDKRIEELRAKTATADNRMKAEYEERISELKDRNRKMKDRLNDDKSKVNENWQDFKREFNHDMDELGKSLKDFSIDNKR
jgi:predicted RNase H-like nuclease (RuvC/YqgF family)